MTFTIAPIIPELTRLLNLHHQLYELQCKGEAWEELSSRALKAAGIGSDWTPDFNHGIGRDQTTDDGTRISNKSGTLIKKMSELKFSGSRTTKHSTIKEKIAFLENKTEDYILLLSQENKSRKKIVPGSPKVYYIILIDSNDLNYHNQEWTPTLGKRGKKKGQIVGCECVADGKFKATITDSMSHQLWTNVYPSLFKECFKIEV